METASGSIAPAPAVAAGGGAVGGGAPCVGARRDGAAGDGTGCDAVGENTACGPDGGLGRCGGVMPDWPAAVADTARCAELAPAGYAAWDAAPGAALGEACECAVGSPGCGAVYRAATSGRRGGASRWPGRTGSGLTPGSRCSGAGDDRVPPGSRTGSSRRASRCGLGVPELSELRERLPDAEITLAGSLGMRTRGLAACALRERPPRVTEITLWSCAGVMPGSGGGSPCGLRRGSGTYG